MTDKVRTTSRRSGGWLLGLLVVTAAVVAVLGIYKVWYHYQTVDLGYELAEETKLHRELFGENRKLRLELESLRRTMLARLRVESPQELHVPSPNEIIHVE